MKIVIINGPNLNLLGVREPDIYGSQKFETYLEILKKKFPTVFISYYQSNIEGELVDKIQEFGFVYDGIILNAGGYTHTSVAISDAISAVTSPVIEVHISNIANRESFRHTSLLTPVCIGGVFGFGLESYEMAIYGLLQKKK